MAQTHRQALVAPDVRLPPPRVEFPLAGSTVRFAATVRAQASALRFAVRNVTLIAGFPRGLGN
ncbi:MAG TPA: hypothetical protein VFE47_12285 [Tepidisphaeraceae bacterium]|nr:hypothetical protein [Tepidisphaeraceae bacterium]